MKVAKRVLNAGTETAFEVLAKAQALEREGKKIIHLQIGEPDFDTPENIKVAGIKAIENNKTHYSPSAGLYDFRKIIGEYISKTRNIPVAPEEVVVAPGGKDIIFFTGMALLEEGDEAIYPNPGYPIYESVIKLCGATPVPMVLREENDFSFNRHEFEKLITPKTRLVVINSPQNPTGGIISKEDLEFIASLAIKHNFYVLSDEIYSRLIYEGEHFSIASIPGMKEKTIILDGMSKTYAMTGWRLGYAVANKEIISYFTKLITNSDSCTATFTQFAGMEALTGDQSGAEKMKKEFEVRRNLIIDGLNSISGFSCKMPKGAFYAFPNVKSFNRKAKEIADHLLYNAGVAVLAGTSFGEYGEGYIRLSYANSQENIKEALKKIEEAMKNF